MEKDDRSSILSVSQSRRTLTLKSIVRRGGDDRKRGDIDTGKGPIGLTTVFEPSDPADSIVDVVFVHGLNGGSNSTWSQNSDPALFWPKEWLGKDDAFKDARIHTFGYNSSFTQESVLNINDFATSLLVSIKDCPTIPRDDWVPPLILIGHSMGGLVIKKAFVLSNQKKEFQSISERVLTMFFLATPHRGSDSAALLSRLLSMSGARPFVGELHRNSPTIESINTEFPRFCERLSLFSFFETQPMNYGIGKGLIVDKESAVLNYSNETTTYLAANHRNVAKFSSPSDPAYISIRNALATTIDLLRDHRKTTRQKLDEEQRQALSAFLGVSDAPENTLSELITSHLEGSCDWFLQKDNFRRWRDSSCSQMLWVQGKPGVGKSVLAGHIVDDMRRSEVPKDCCFYFFMHSDKPRCTIASFLLSMAWQMAAMHAEVHDIIHKSLKLWTSEKIGTVDHNPIWRRLFLGGILKAKLNKTQFWIIDGLDECRNGPELVNFLVRMQELWPMSILITSRNPFDPTSLSQPQTNALFEQLREDDTKQDIALFIQSQIHAVPARDFSDRDDMARAIVEKSMGCFLWVQLVMSQLRSVHTIADAQRVLHSAPSDMNELYRRILDSLSQESHGKRLAKSILRWAACSSRPLTSSELRTALEIDLDDVIPNVEKAVDAYCGHLVYFERENRASTHGEPRLRFVHSTAKEFLTNHSVDSEFVIDKAAGHKSLASACLKYLSGNDVRLLKHRRTAGADRGIEEHPPFMTYASASVFEHIAASGNESVGLCAQLVAFLNSPNVPHWVEHLAEQSELSRLLQAGTVIGQLLKKGNVEDIAGISSDMKALASWSSDLVRLVTKFGKQLQSHPHAIHSLVPPFCPHESAIYKRFASPRGLHLVGLSSQAKGWDDCSSIITYPRGETITATACSEQYFALGTMLSKVIVVYDEMTCQETKRLSNGEAVMLIKIGASGKYIASAGPKSVKIWELGSWKLISEIPTPLKCMSLEFVEDDKLLLIAMKNNMLVYWDVANDDFVDELRWTLDPDVKEDYDARAPVTSVFSAHQNLLAISYRGQDLLVWNLDREMIHDVYCRESGSRLDTPSTHKRRESILSLTFSAAPGSHALVAGYMDGELVLYDTSQGTLRHRVLDVNAQCMSSSPDGRTLATGDALGTIQLFDLETLKFLYRINFDAQFIAVRTLAFTSDSHRLLDVRGSQCRVWEPLELLRPEADDMGSDAMSVSISAHDLDFEGPMEIVYITAVVVIEFANSILCGKDDGSVHVYDAIRGGPRQELISKLGAAISFLLFDERSKILVCADRSSRVLCSKLTTLPQNDFRLVTMIDICAPGAITQILGNRGLTRLLVCTQDRCLLYAPHNSTTEPINEVKWHEQWVCFSWSPHPTSDDLLVLFRRGRAYTYHWATLTPCIQLESPNVTPAAEDNKLGISLRGLMPSAKTLLVKIIPNSDYFVTICYDPQLADRRTEVQLWRNASLEPGQSEAEAISEFSPLSSIVDHVLGAYNGRLVFLKTDGWICSLPLKAIDAEKIVPHFFIPADWLSLTNQIMVDLTVGGDVIFVKRSELAVIKRGLRLEGKSIRSSHSTSSSKFEKDKYPRASSLSGASTRASDLSRASVAQDLSKVTGIAERPHLNGASRWKTTN